MRKLPLPTLRRRARLGKFLVYEDAAKELADGALGQVLAELDGLRGLVGGEALLAEGQDLLLRRPGARPLYDEGLDGLAPVLIRDTYRDGLGHVGVLEEDLFHLARVDVVAGSQDHIFLPVHDVEVAVLVHLRDVAGVQPAVFEGCCRLLGHVEVALHYLRALDDELPRLADGHLTLARLYVHYPGVRRGDGDTDAA